MSKWKEPLKPARKKTKVKRKRVMTAEQKAAAVERLRLAREAKGSQNLSVDSNIRNLPDDHFLSPKKVKQWLKIWKSKLQSSKGLRDSKDWKDRLEYQIIENYCRNLQSYLSTGVYMDLYYGENREHKVKFKCIAPAYKDGVQVRTKGVWYSDIGIWGGDDNEDGK